MHPMFDPANLGDQEAARLANLHSLVQAGVQPYPARVRRTHTVAEARTLYDDGQAGDQQVTVSGRINRRTETSRGSSSSERASRSEPSR